MQKPLDTTGSPLSLTPLHQLHVEKKAKLVAFCGYEMPVSYPMGVLNEHLHTRSNAGLFDVSHMGQVLIQGDNAAQKLEALLPLNLQDMPINQQVYTLLLNNLGGILDDLIITHWQENTFFLVVNAACKQKDIAYFKQALDSSLEINELSDRALLALQGPQAVEVLASLNPDVSQLVFMQGMHTELCGVECFITRSGYTGEDGFEISLPADRARQVADILLSADSVELIGLGARDSLRLEAGLCLYGQDMNESTTPSEASLNFAINKIRRSGEARQGGFPGAEVVLPQIPAKVQKKRVGLLVQGRVPVRQGIEIESRDGCSIGSVTSGGFAPSLNQPIAMAYIDKAHSSIDTTLVARVRGKAVAVKVVKMPFVPQRYYRGPSSN